MSEQAVTEPPREAKKGKTAQDKNTEYNERKKSEKKRLEEARRLADSAKITSVKHMSGKTFITYSIIENNATRAINETSTDEPHPDFLEGLRALAPHVANAFFHDKAERAWQAKNISVKGVNFKEFDGGNLHAGIVSMLKLDCGNEANLNVPNMPLHPEDKLAGGWSNEAAKAIENVLEHTRAFLANHRATGDLFANLDD